MMRKLFSMENLEKLNPIPHQESISAVIGDGLTKISLHPVTFKVTFDENASINDVELGDIEDDDEVDWVESLLQKGFWDVVVVQNVKQVICINGAGVNRDSRSGGADVKDEELHCRMAVAKNSVTLRDLTELIFRVKGSKFDLWYELYHGISTHIDDKGTLFIQANFGHGS